MKKYNFFIFICLSLLLMVSCHRKPLMEETYTLQEKSWNRFRVLTFKPELVKENCYYDIVLEISYMDGFAYDELPLHTILTAPDGQKNILSKKVRIRNKSGEYQGNVYGDTWTVKKVVFDHKQLKNKGIYTFDVQQMTQYYELPGIVSVKCVVLYSNKQ